MNESTVNIEEINERLAKGAAAIEGVKAYFKAVRLDYKAVAAIARNNAQIVSDTKAPTSTRPSAARMRRRGIAL